MNLPETLLFENSEYLGDVDTTEWQLFEHISPGVEEETMDVALQHISVQRLQTTPALFTTNVEDNQQPISPRGRPSKVSMAGDLNFTVEINSTRINNKTFLYSHKLNRIYVNMDTDFSVQFNWDHTKASPGMYVRATPVFWDEAQAEKRVERCISHRHNNALPNVIVHNVLNSSSVLGTQGVDYCGNPSLADSWYSVLVMFTKTSEDACNHAYKFGCKNSCTSGINRRSIGIVFTLENVHGVIMGRQSVGVRVCACPRRDIIKDEEQEMKTNGDKAKKRPIKSTEPPPMKYIKLDVDAEQQELYILPPLPVVRLETAKIGLEVMLASMQQLADLKKLNPQSVPHIDSAVLNDCIYKHKEAIENIANKILEKQ